MRTAICASMLLWVAMAATSPARSAAEQHVRDLRSSVPSVREQAAIALGALGDRSAVPALIEALKDPEGAVRCEAAKALGAINDARATDALIAALRDADMNVRLYTAYALGEIKEAKAASALLQALRDPEWCVRDQAAWALREIHDPKIAAPLAAILKDESADVAHVVWLLRQVGGADAVGPLATLLKDPNAETRMRAVGALGELRDPAVVGPLIVALADGDPGIRLKAVTALSAIKDDRVQQALEQLLAREDDPTVRQAAQDAVKQISRLGGLAAHWSFDDQSTTVARDVTGLGTDGEIRGCTPVEGKVGHALRFGSGRYISLGKPAALPIAESPFTVMAWAKSEARNGVVVARGGASCGFSLYIKDGVPKFGIHGVQGGPTYIAAGTDEVVGAWVHLAGVVRNDRIELYVNGKLAATAKTDGYLPSNCGQGMEIGFDAGNSPAEITDNFDGIIDEVKCFDAALAEAEIAKESSEN